MENNRRIMIKSLVNGIVVLYEPVTRLRIEWKRKNEKKPVPLEKLREAIWTQGVANLFIDGILVIEEKDSFDILKDLGLEAPNAEEPQLVITYTDPQRERLLKTAPLQEFKETFASMSYEQKKMIADYAVDNKLISFDKCAYIKELIGTDVIKAVELRDESDKAL